ARLHPARLGETRPRGCVSPRRRCTDSFTFVISRVEATGPIGLEDCFILIFVSFFFFQEVWLWKRDAVRGGHLRSSNCWWSLRSSASWWPCCCQQFRPRVKRHDAISA